MLRNNADARRCSYFELGLPVVKRNDFSLPGAVLAGTFIAFTNSYFTFFIFFPLEKRQTLDDHDSLCVVNSRDLQHF